MAAMFQDDGAIRVIEGPESVGEAALGLTGEGEYEVEPAVLGEKFKKFVREFKYNAPSAGVGHILTMKYRDQFQNNCEQGYYYLEINLNDLDAPGSDGEVLSHCLKQRPSTYLPVCERALRELYFELVKKEGDDLPGKVPTIQLMLTYDIDLDGTFGTMKPLKIRQLTSDQVEKLVVIQGIVVSAKKSRHKARKVCLKCSNCENLREITVGAGFNAAHIPSACDGNSLRGPMEKCPPNPFVIVDDLCEYADEQILKLQELPDHVPVGEMPRHVDLCVSQYLVDKASPGARLTAVGVFCATEHSTGGGMGGSRSRGTDTVKYSYLQVLGAHVSQGSAVEISPEDEEKFEQMARDPQIRDNIYRSIAPAICASDKDVIDEVKKAVACLLFGGSRKLLPDGTRMRGDINVLLLGDPGTAKSQFLKFSEKAAPVAVYTSGKGSSAAGLTAAIIRDKDGFALEGGAMVLADGGIVCIDEFDKMDVKDRVAIHEAMEQQTISIAKAGITTMLNTRCSVLAAANPRFGTYDDLTNTADQMDFETTILSRFDMMFLVKDVRDPDRDFNLALHMVSLHKGEVMEHKEGPLPVAQLRKFLSYCRRRCAPRLTPAAGEVLKNHYVSIRAKMKQEKESGKDSGIPITVRQLEAIIRISESLAKMELCEDVNIGHVEEALRLFTVSTLDSANRDRGVGVDTLNEEEKNELHKAEEQIRRRVQRGGRINRYQLESWLVSSGGIDERMARRAIYLMLMRQEFLERANATLQRL
jgi:DNA replication licensing factor MCM5